MTLITNFPPEVLNTILSWREVQFIVIKLWICGNKTLNKLLSYGGCTEVHLKDHKPNSKSIFPKMLLKLHHLRKLSIDRHGYPLESSYQLSRSLRGLSSSIQSLKLDCKDAVNCLLEFTLRDPDCTESGILIDKNIPVQYCNIGKAPLNHHMWDLSMKFPNLKYLSLNAPHSCFTDDMVRQLPKTLTRLRINNLSMEAASLLPRNLLFLETNVVWQVKPGSLRHLPPNLLTLNVPISSYDIGTLEGAPRSIQRFQSNSLIWSKAFGEAFPNITKLEINTSDYASLLLWLPCSLTDLRMELANLSREELLFLPSSITHLRANSINWCTVERKADFPALLCSLQIENLGNDEKCPHLLPDALTRLHCAHAIPEGLLIPHLPVGLRYLHLALSDTAGDEQHFVDAFPSSLRELNLANSIWSTQRLSNGKRPPFSPDEHVSRLISIFPPHLTTLSMFFWREPAVKALPNTITSLHLGMTAIKAEEFASLPKSLTALTVNVSSVITAQALETLPDAIYSLDIGTHSQEIQADALLGLHSKRLLRHLLVGTRATPRYSFASIKHIPPNLLTLHITVAHLSEADIPHLPTSLMQIRLGSPHPAPEKLIYSIFAHLFNAINLSVHSFGSIERGMSLHRQPR